MINLEDLEIGKSLPIKYSDQKIQNFEIHLAAAKDCSDLFNLQRDSVRSICTSQYNTEQIDMWLDGRHPDMYLAAIERGELWVAMSSDTILGLVEVQGNEVTKLFVSGTAAGSGVGKALMVKAIEHIRHSGENRIYLESTISAQGFYRKLGFAEIGTGTFSHGASTVSLEIVQMELLVD